ncbi:hypothetical protein ACQWFT_25810, partial [Salmonella enterica subsp. enterica serovar Infantis]
FIDYKTHLVHNFVSNLTQKEFMIMNDIITVKEAAQLLELTPQRERTMCKQGSIDSNQSGRNRLIKS